MAAGEQPWLTPGKQWFTCHFPQNVVWAECIITLLGSHSKQLTPPPFPLVSKRSFIVSVLSLFIFSSVLITFTCESILSAIADECGGTSLISKNCANFGNIKNPSVLWIFFIYLSFFIFFYWTPKFSWIFRVGKYFMKSEWSSVITKLITLWLIYEIRKFSEKRYQKFMQVTRATSGSQNINVNILLSTLSLFVVKVLQKM